MKVAAVTLALAAAAVAAPAAQPLEKRDNIDATVFNFALTLEHLENAFYRQNYRRFGNQFADSQFKRNLKQVGKHEAQHVKLLTAALRAAGATPVKECRYNFGNLNAQSFIQTAAVLEGVGAAAYAGAAQLITNKQYLTQAAAILSVEARHSAFIRGSLNQSPLPQTLENTLSINQVWTLVKPMIVSCPAGNPQLPVKAFPKLTLQGSQGSYNRGSQTVFTVGPAARLTNNMFIAYPLTTGNIFVRAIKTGDRRVRAVVPKGEYGPIGQSYPILVNGQGSITDANTIAGPAILQVVAPYLVNAPTGN